MCAAEHWDCGRLHWQVCRTGGDPLLVCCSGGIRAALRLQPPPTVPLAGHSCLLYGLTHTYAPDIWTGLGARQSRLQSSSSTRKVVLLACLFPQQQRQCGSDSPRRLRQTTRYRL